MFNMDNQEQMEKLDIDLLIKGKYLKSYPTKTRNSDCKYFIEKEKSGEIDIICSVHGTTKQLNEILSARRKSEELNSKIARIMKLVTIIAVSVLVF